MQDDFVFDLQRFDEKVELSDSGAISQGIGVSETELAGYDTATGHTIQVSSDSAGTSGLKYFDNMQAALNYVFTTDTYKASDTVTATIKLLNDVTLGSAWLIGGKATFNKTTKDGADTYTIQVVDSISKYNVTIDLDGHEYYFNQYISSENAKDVGAAKGIRTYVNADTSGSNSSLTIKNGTLSVSNQQTAKFERLAATYNDVTFDSVTINAGGVSKQNTGVAGAIIAHDTGKLTLSGTTTFTGLTSKTGDYYGVTGRTYGDDNNIYKAGFEVNIDTTGTVGRVGIYNRSGSNAGKAVLKIANGEITEVVYGSTPSVATGGDNYTEISGGTFGSTPTDSHVSLASGYFFAPVDGKYAVTNTDGWYGSGKAWSYVAAPTTGSIGSADASLAGSNGTLTLTDAAPITTGVNFDASASLFSSLTSYKTFTAEDAHSAVTVTGNDYLTKITGSKQADNLTAGTSKVTLDGGAGSDVLDGASKGDNVFVYNGGADIIKGRTDTDIVNLDGIDAVTEGSAVSAEGNGFKVNFGDDNTLTFAENTAAKVRSDNQIYTYAQDFIGRGKSMTLSSATTVKALDSNNDYNAISAAGATGVVSLVGNTFANTLTAGNFGSTLDGGLGNDNLYGGDGADTFVYGDKNGGKDVIYNYGAGDDKFSVTSANIASGTTNSNGDLIFKINNSNSITFKAADDGTEVTTVTLAGGSDSLTKDGVIGATDSILTVFSDQKGRIDISDSIFSGVAGINASKVTKNAVTMVGGTAGGTFTFAANKKADVFEYGGGAVTLNSYETDTDKIDLGNFALGTFSVDGSGVSLSAGSNTVVLSGDNIKDNEVLIHDSTGKNNSFKTFVFHADGVLHDKKKATSATLSAGVAGNAYKADSSIKKITVDGISTEISVQAGDTNNTIIDASAVSSVVSGSITLAGGSKNDKLTGRKGADTFEYVLGGKDVITNYESDDVITLGETYNLGAAKITQSKKSVTFKFSNKNSLNIKSDDAIGTIKIGETDYNFGKNAIIQNGAASLTSEFSGTYKAGSGVTKIDGSAIAKKNYTMQGTSEAETLTAGGADSNNAKNRKVTFKGGGGDDSLVGGSGKDTFFYAKNDTGNSTVDYFSYANDNLKIKRTLTGISKDTNGLKFAMGDSSLTLKTDDKSNNIGSSNVLIKANNTLYWFEGSYLCTAKDSESRDQIKSVLRNKSDYAIVDLNYSTNLIKGGVANETETVFTAAMASNYQIK